MSSIYPLTQYYPTFLKSLKAAFWASIGVLFLSIIMLAGKNSGKFFQRIFSDPEKNALFNFLFLALRLKVKKLTPFAIASFTAFGVP